MAPAHAPNCHESKYRRTTEADRAIPIETTQMNYAVGALKPIGEKTSPDTNWSLAKNLTWNREHYHFFSLAGTDDVAAPQYSTDLYCLLLINTSF